MQLRICADERGSFWLLIREIRVNPRFQTYLLVLEVHFPIQKELKMRFKISSAVVAPVISSN